MRLRSRHLLLTAASLAATASVAMAQAPANAPTPPRGLKNLNGYFPFTPVKDADEWKTRRAEIERRTLIAEGRGEKIDCLPIRTAALAAGQVLGEVSAANFRRR